MSEEVTKHMSPAQPHGSATVVPFDSGAGVQVSDQANRVIATVDDRESQDPTKERRMSAYVGGSYFDDENGEAPAFYAYVLALVTPRTLGLVLLVLCVLQLFVVLLALGLGQEANSLVFSLGVELCFYGVLQLVWREDVHLSCTLHARARRTRALGDEAEALSLSLGLKPWSRSFCFIAVLHFLYDGGLYALKESTWTEPRARDIEHMCEIAPFSPIYIGSEILRKFVLVILIQNVVMLQAHKDRSPHLFRLNAIIMSIACLASVLSQSGNESVCMLVPQIFYLW